MTDKLPIAVLTDRISRALDYMQWDLKMQLREINIPHNRIIDSFGQRYFLVNEPIQLEGIEISQILIIPGASRNPKYSEMYDKARTRIR